MKWTYKPAQKLLMVDEGGYSNHPQDPGGVTLNGVIQTRYNEYRKAKGLPQKALTKAMLGTPEWEKERDEIYYQYYAKPVRYDELDAGVDYSVHDYGVNSGPGRAGKVLRRVLGLPSNTSTVTPEVIAAAKKRLPEALIDAINAERKAFLQSLRTCPTFCGGWLKRVSRVVLNSKKFAKGIGQPAVVLAEKNEETGKATVPEPKATKNVVKGAAPTAGAEEAVRDPQGWMDWIMANPIETAAILAGVGLVVFLVLHAINTYHKHKSEEPMPGTAVVPEMKVKHVHA